METFILLLKDFDCRLLETGDKQTTIQLRTQSHADSKRISQFINEPELSVTIEKVDIKRSFGGSRTD